MCLGKHMCTQTVKVKSYLGGGGDFGVKFGGGVFISSSVLGEMMGHVTWDSNNRLQKSTVFRRFKCWMRVATCTLLPSGDDHMYVYVGSWERWRRGESRKIRRDQVRSKIISKRKE